MSDKKYALTDALPEEVVAEKIARVQARLRSLSLSGEHIDRRSAVGACLGPLLAAIEWAGEGRHLQEALPHFDEVNTLDSVRAVLARLNYETIPQARSMRSLKGDVLPCLFHADDGNYFVVIAREDTGTYVVYDASQNAFCHVDAGKIGRGTAYIVRPLDLEATRRNVEKNGWIQALLWRFKRTFFNLFLLTFAINMLALVVPLYVMSVYDKVLGAKSPMTLAYLLGGVVIALCTDMFLRSVRARYLAYLGSRIECLVTTSAFEKLLHLPLGMSEAAPIGSQVTRLKQFESVREVFSGPLATTVLDLPFFIIFLTVIIWIGGFLGFVPVGLILIYAVMASITVPMTRVRVQQAGNARSQNRNFLMELATKRETIRDAGAEDVFVDRFREVAGQTLVTQLSAQKLSMMVQTVSQGLVVIAGALTVGIGAHMVLEGDLTPGALIAVMTLVWRVLQPLQSVFLSLNRIGQTRDSFMQINGLMKLATERQPGVLPTFFRKFRGRLVMKRVAFRFSAKAEPALLGVDLTIEPGQFVVITGPSGAGKSTLLKMMARLYQPQGGFVTLDDLDLRQLDVAELRHAIGYVPQKPHFFYGTVSQNMKLANPAAQTEDMIKALEDVGVLDTHKDISAVLDTRLSADISNRFSPGFAQQMMLAQALVKNPSIYLMDEPGNGLDFESDEALKRLFKRIKGKATMVVVTQRPSHMKLADRIVVLNNGVVAGDGPPEQILPALVKSFGSSSLGKS